MISDWYFTMEQLLSAVPTPKNKRHCHLKTDIPNTCRLKEYLRNILWPGICLKLMTKHGHWRGAKKFSSWEVTADLRSPLGQVRLYLPLRRFSRSVISFFMTSAVLILGSLNVCLWKRDNENTDDLHNIQNLTSMTIKMRF